MYLIKGTTGSLSDNFLIFRKLGLKMNANGRSKVICINSRTRAKLAEAAYGDA